MIYNTEVSNWVTESSYPLNFRKEDAKKLGEHLKQRHSVNLIGMKRVGISNFLRFFLYRPDIVETYISKSDKHLFISVDLNDLVEREIYPFWTLTLKRIADKVESSTLPEATKKSIASLFLTSIQSQDLFLVIDNVRRALQLIDESGMYVTLFFLRFDRLQDAFNPTFFDNLEGLRDATNERLAYVFTSYRSLDAIFPQVKTSLSVFAQQMYVKPAKTEDMQTVYAAYQKRYKLQLTPAVEKDLFALVSGNMQYLQLALIILHERKDEIQDIATVLLSDERITLQSEELWESLQREEQQSLLQVIRRKTIATGDKAKNTYVWETGFLKNKAGEPEIFSPLFASYIAGRGEEEAKKNQVVHLTRKENALFNFLQKHLGDICDREQIIETVWAEYEDFGISDWAIDRLVARVRVKLKEQESPYEVVTVRTRGYKLVMA